MSPSRFSPAARQQQPETTPWPTSTPTGPNTVPDPNDGTNTRRGSSPSPRKMKGRRQERPAEEEPKFNVGPKSPRSLARRFMRRTHPERVIDPYTMDVPNYPPPSFQEAMSDSPVPVSPTATVAPTMPPQGEATTIVIHAQEPDARPNDRENVHINVQRASATFDSDSGSDDYVNVPGTRNDALRNARQEIGNEQEMETESQASLTFPSSLSRGRRDARDVMDDDDQAEEEEVAQAAATTRRHNSLSPLRTLFPSLHFTLHDRAASAMEPASPPHSHFRSMSFFRSTTSLASGNTTPTLKSKSSITNLAQHTPSPKRGILTRKDRAERPERPEILEIDPTTDNLGSWEVVDSVEAKQAPVAPEPTMKDRKKLEKIIAKRSKERKERRDADRISPVSEDVPVPDPFRSQPPTTPPPASPVSVEVEIPAPAPPQTQSQPQTEPLRPSQTPPQPQIEQPRPQRQPIVYPADKKVHIPFIERSVPPRPAPQTPPPQPISPPATPSRATQLHEHPLHPTTPVKSHNGSPQATAVRHRQTNGPLQPLNTQRSQVFNASPLANQWQADEISPAGTIGTGTEAVFDPTSESALETLPPSPAESIGNYRSDTPPKAGYSNKFRSAIADMAGLQFTLSTDSFATAPDTAPWAETPMKKHYPGRPLPVAPGPHGVAGARLPVEQRYIPLTPPPDSEKNRERREEVEEKAGKSRGNNCPEALLIDLDDNTFVSGGDTPVAATSQVDLRVLSVPSTPGLPAAGFPIIGCGHGHGHGHGHQCGHIATASMSTPNLTQPIFPTSLHVMSMTPNQSQVHNGAAPGTPVWPPLYAIPTEPRWLCSCGVDHDHETVKYWSRSPMPSPMAKEFHVVPCAGLSRAQTHPPAPLGQSMCVMPTSVHVNGR